MSNSPDTYTHLLCGKKLQFNIPLNLENCNNVPYLCQDKYT